MTLGEIDTPMVNAMNSLKARNDNSRPQRAARVALKGQALVCLDPTLPVPAVKDALAGAGWQVFCAKGGGELRALAMEMEQATILLSDRLLGRESVWLTARKILMAHPHMRVVIVGQRPSAKAERMAHFIGAEFVAFTEIGSLIERVNK